MQATDKIKLIKSGLLHWLFSIGVFSFLGLLIWAAELHFFPLWRSIKPDLHAGTGILLLVVCVCFCVWQLYKKYTGTEKVTKLQYIKISLAQLAMLFAAVGCASGFWLGYELSGLDQIERLLLFMSTEEWAGSTRITFSLTLHKISTWAMTLFLTVYIILLIYSLFSKKVDNEEQSTS